MKIELGWLALLFWIGGSAWSAPLPMTAAPAPGTPGAAGGSFSDATTKADGYLTESEVLVVQLETIVKGGADGSGCPPNFNIRTFVAEKKALPGEKVTGPFIPGSDLAMNTEWDFYSVCQAVAAKNETACNDIPARVVKNAFNEAITDRDKCVALTRTMLANIAYDTRDPRFPAICRAQHFTGPGGAAGTLDSLCTAWQTGGGNPDALARVIVSQIKLSPDMALDAARETVCDPTWHPVDAAVTKAAVIKFACDELNDYRAVAVKKQSKACRGGLCRMLTGEGVAACESYALKAKKYVCSNFYQAKYSAEREAVITDRLKIAEALVVAASKQVGTVQEAQKLNDRLDRIYSLRDRLNRALQVIGPLAKNTGKAPAPQTGKKAK